MFEQRYKQLYEHLHPSEALIQDVLSAPRRGKQTARLSKRWIVAICCFVLLLTTGTAIAGTFDLMPILEQFFPDTAKDFSAVNLSDTEQGITMTVMQANLTEEGHVDLLIEFSGEGIDDSALPFFYSTPLTDIGQGVILEYDKPNAILWRQSGYADANHPDWFADSGLYTVTMHRICLGRYFFPTFHTNLDLTALPIADSFENTATLWDDLNADEESQTCLVPGDPIITMAKGMAITAFGFTEDGYLIIQNRSPMNLLDGEGIGACLVPRGYAEDDWQHWVMWTNSRLWIDENSSSCYCENIYPVTAEELGSYTLRTYYYTVEEVLEGDWTVTIDVNNLSSQTE